MIEPIPTCLEGGESFLGPKQVEFDKKQVQVECWVHTSLEVV
jgi:hypothetical protein